MRKNYLMITEIPIVVDRCQDKYIAQVIGMKGIFAFGDSEEEVIEEIKEKFSQFLRERN